MSNLQETDPQRCFLLSNIPSKTERENLLQKISDLGGICLDLKQFDTSVTHVIFGKLSRTEKFLGACITGKWILSPKYIEDSHQVQMWLDEDEYEFSISDVGQPEGLASSAKRWRWKNHMNGSLPFADWLVALYMKAKKQACFERILKCGGAKTVSLKCRRNTPDVAFVLVDSQEYETLQNLQENHDLLFIREDYLGDFIIKDPEPDLFDYIIDNDSSKQNVESITRSPFQDSKTPQKPIKKTLDSGQKGEVPEKKLPDTGSINDVRKVTTDLLLSKKRNFNQEDISQPDLENWTELSSIRKTRNEKRLLTTGLAQKTDFHPHIENDTLENDGNGSPIKKMKKNPLKDHIALRFSPKNLRSSLKRKYALLKNQSQPLKIFEDEPSKGKNFKILSNNLSSKPQENSRSFIEKNEKMKNCSTNGPSTSTVRVSKPSVSGSKSSLSSNNAVDYATKGIIPSPIEQCSLNNVSGDSTTNSLSSQTVDLPVSLNSISPSCNKRNPNYSLGISNSSIKSTGKSSADQHKERHVKACLEDVAKSKTALKKSVQRSLLQFGFQNCNSPKKKSDDQESPLRSKHKSSSSSIIESSASIRKETAPVKIEKLISNTPDTAIELFDDSQAESQGHSDILGEPSLVTSHLQQPIKTEWRSLVKNKTPDEEESYDDLLREIIYLCEDDSGAEATSIHSPGAEQCKSVHTKTRTETYHEVHCSDNISGDENNAIDEEVNRVETSCQTKNDACRKYVENDSLLPGNSLSSFSENSCKPQKSLTMSSNKFIQASTNTKGKAGGSTQKGDVKDTGKALDQENNGYVSRSNLPCLSQTMIPPMDVMSYSLHISSKVSLPLDELCADGDTKALISPLIAQWMSACREMKFYSVALDHSRPDINRKPTTELLSELMNLVTCESNKIRNLAFSYLMAWFEGNPPTSPLNIKLYSDLLCNKDQTFLTDVFESLTSLPDSEGHHLLLNFIVAVLEVNFWHNVNSGNKNEIKECLLIRCLWSHSSSAIHFNSSVMNVMKAFRSILSMKPYNSQSVHSMITFLGLIGECLRLVGNYWNIKNLNYLTDCMLTFSKEVAERITNVFTVGDESSVILILQSVSPPWLRTLVIATILSNLNNSLVMETIQVSNICLSSIVTQYFFLLPPLSCDPDIKKSPKCVLEKERIYEPAAVLKSTSTMKVNKKNGKGETQIHVAAIRNDYVRMEQLLSIPEADVNMKDNCGWTPLHEACNHGSYECVELLLNYVPPVNSVFNNENEMKRRVAIDAKGDAGKTALHDAVLNGHTEICKLLLRYGGKRLLEDKTVDGYTPLDFAQTKVMRNALLLDNAHPNLSTPTSETISQPQGANNSLPISTLYDKVLKWGQNHRHATSKDCSWFLSLLSMLISSYLKFVLLKGDQSLNESDKNVLNNIDHHISVLEEHLRRITSPDTFRALQFHIQMLRTVVNEFSF